MPVDVTMNEKVLRRMMEIFCGTMTNYEAGVLALQFLCWSRIEKEEGSQGHNGLKQKRAASINPHSLREAWKSLGSRPGKIGAAYSKVPSRIQPSQLSSAIDICSQLSDTGVLDKFDPTDIFFQVSGREAGEYSLPPELADLMVGLARVQAGSSVYTPWDNAIQLAARSAKLGASVYMETVSQLQTSALISLFVDGQIVIAPGDPILEPSAVENGKLKRFDTCLAFPPIGPRRTPDAFERDWYGRFKERTNSGTVLAIWHILSQTHGRAVVAVPQSLLFSPGADRSVREELLKQGHIEAVIAMPSGIMAHTNLPFALLVLNMNRPRQSIRFVNADSDLFREPISKARAKLVRIDGIVARAAGDLTDEYVAEVRVETVLANDSALQVNRYVMPESSRRIAQLLEAAPTRTLGDIVTFIRPIATTTREDAVNAWEVGAADLPEVAYIAPPGKEVKIDLENAEKNKHQFLQPLDIVLIIKGSVGKVGIVPRHIPPPGEGGWVIGQSGVIIRVSDYEMIDPKVLAMYLRSPVGQKLLEGITVKGATIPLIQQRELQKIQIIIPMKNEAVEIGNILDEQARIQQEIDLLRERQIELAQNVWCLD